MHRNLWRPTMVAVLLGAMTLHASPGVDATVLYDPEPTPTPSPRLRGGRVVVSWAGLAMTFPADWKVRPKPDPGSSFFGGAGVLTAFGPEGEACTVDVYDPELIESWADLGIEPSHELTISGVVAERFDEPWGGPDGVSAYTLYADAVRYSLLCTAPQVPDDRWLSLARTVELFPPTFTTGSPATSG